MRYRKLGRTGIEISDIGFGAWGIGGKQWIGGSDEESRAALRRALELESILSIRRWLMATAIVRNS